MDEFKLIDQFFAGRGTLRDDVRIGIGDDAAVTRWNNDYELVIATDALCEGTHFLPGTPPHALGHRCLAVNLSDLAAMGAEPLWCTLALSLPEAEPDWVSRFANGFFELADRFQTTLIGGDTVRGPLAMTVTVHGRVTPGRAVCRDGAREGDLIYVTGVPGLAAAGLEALRESAANADVGAESVRRFLYPEPRITEGRAVVGLATAMIDVSDGLMVDVTRMLIASGFGAKMDIGSLPPVAEGVNEAQVLNGGDDYELCFTVPPLHQPEFEKRVVGWPCPVTGIGTVTRNTDIIWLINGRPCNTVNGSYEHFS
jgi:thiamine-monophosphate kinase